VKKLEGVDTELTRAVAAMLRAALSLADGDLDGALDDYAIALDHAQGIEAAHLVAAIRYRLGELIGGDAGRGLIADAEAWARGQGVVAPARWLPTWCPQVPG
jgi:hypothetical protein